MRTVVRLRGENCFRCPRTSVRDPVGGGRGCGAILRRCRMKAPCPTALILRCSPAHQLKAQLGPLSGKPRRTHQNGGRCVLRGSLREHLRMRTAVQLASRGLRMRTPVQLASRGMRTVVQLRGENCFRCPRTSVRDLPGRWRTRVRGSSSASQNEGALHNGPHPEVLARTSAESTARSLARRASKDAPKRRQVRPSRLASRAPQDEDRRAARFARAQDEDRCAASRRKLFPVSSHVRSRSSRSVKDAGAGQFFGVAE
ncbi:hypothetical protein MAUB1S_08457 [Mycolicibacterium aubagnense]